MYERIEESELKRRSLKNVSTTPTRRTPFGESGLSAEQLKERFDLLGVYIANRLNEVFEGMESGEFIDSAKFVDGRGLGEIIRSLFDGSGASEIYIETPTETLTLAEAVNRLVRLLNEIENGDVGEFFGAIRDVIELPSENIHEKEIYRLLTVTFIHNRHVVDNSVCYCVNGLPEVGIPATDGKQSINAYYNTVDGEISGYLDSTLSAMFGIPAGWYKAKDLFPAAGWTFGGVIADEEDDPKDSVIRALAKYVSYSYKNGKWTLVSDFDVKKWLSPAMNKSQGYWIYSYNNLDRNNARPDVIFSSYQLNDEHEWQIPERKNGIMKCARPVDGDDCSNKEYVDDLGEAVLSGLDAIIAAQNELFGG